MNGPTECAAVIPCRNEAAHIGALVRAVREWLPHVVVIDDGSADPTASEARAAGARVLVHSVTQGKGASLQAGLAAARENGFAWALALDGDGQHAPADIPRFLAEADSGPARLIVGNRMNHRASMPWLRRAVNDWLSRTLGAHCHADFPDSQCGFRLIHLDSWHGLPMIARHFEIESEFLVRFSRAGFPIRFVEIATLYGAERSKIKPLRDTVRWFRWWMKIRAERPPAPAAWPRPELLHDGAA